LDVTGGTINATQFGGRTFDGGTQSFNGGSINFNGSLSVIDANFSIDNSSSAVDVPSDLRVEGTATLTVNDGTLNASVIEMFDTGAFVMNGGTVTLSGNFGSNNFSGGGSAQFNGGTLTANTLDFTHAWDLTLGGTTSGSASFTSGFGDTSNISIDWSGGSLMTLDIGGYDQTAYETLFTNGELLFEGSNAGNFSDNFTVSGSQLSLIPEPSSTALIGFALGGLALLRRRRSG
jgi:hypothetical protein